MVKDLGLAGPGMEFGDAAIVTALVSHPLDGQSWFAHPALMDLQMLSIAIDDELLLLRLDQLTPFQQDLRHHIGGACRGPVEQRQIGHRGFTIVGRPIIDARMQPPRSEEHTSELQSRQYLVCRLLLEKKKPPNQQSNNAD